VRHPGIRRLRDHLFGGQSQYAALVDYSKLDALKGAGFTRHSDARTPRGAGGAGESQWNILRILISN
jgi:hypothetical protein